MRRVETTSTATASRAARALNSQIGGELVAVRIVDLHLSVDTALGRVNNAR